MSRTWAKSTCCKIIKRILQNKIENLMEISSKYVIIVNFSACGIFVTSEMITTLARDLGAIHKPTLKCQINGWGPNRQGD